MINPVLVYGLAAAVLVGTLTGWTVRDWKADAELAETLQKAEKTREEMQAKLDAASRDYERWRAEAEPQKIETRNTIREIYRNVQIPANCAVGDTAVQLLQDRVNRATSAASGEPVAKLPQPARTTAPSN